MKTNYLTFFILTSIFVVGDPANAENTTLTLEQAKKIAVDRSLRLEVQRSRIDAARARIGRAKSNYYPTLETKIGSDQGVTSDSKQASTFSYLLARWNIYRGGLDRAASRISDLEVKRADIETEIDKVLVEGDVERIFCNLIYLRDISKIKQKFIGINSDQQALARQIVSRGGGSPSDVVQFDLKASALQSDLAQIEQDYNSMLIQLKNSLGEDFAQSISPTGDLLHQHVQGKVDDYLNTNLKMSPTVKAATIDLETASEKASAVRGRWLPQLDFEANFGALPQAQGDEKNKIGSSFALVATWEIFGGFDTSYQIRELGAEKSSADAQLRLDIRSVIQDIQIAFSQLETLQKRADLEKNNIHTAKKHYDLVFADFRRGYKNSTDFSDAAQAWYEAEVQRKKIDLDFIEKKIELEKKLGARVVTISMKDIDVSAEGGR